MSTNLSHAEEHGHAKDHVPHVLPLKTYLMTWGALMVLTVITVAVSYVDFGSDAINLFVALAVAATKAAIVALVFMHLLYDNKLNTVIFLSGLVFLAIFISFTMFDTETRGVNEAGGLDRPADMTNPFAGTKGEMEMRAQWASSSPAEATPAAAPAAEAPAAEAPAAEAPAAEANTEAAPAETAPAAEPKAEEAAGEQAPAAAEPAAAETPKEESAGDAPAEQPAQ